jgi:hypothetical protein
MENLLFYSEIWGRNWELNKAKELSRRAKKTWMSSLFRQATVCLSLLSLPSKSSKILRGYA